MARRDWLAALLILLGALALRMPWRSGYAYHWDSAQFVLALDRFNPALSVPHAPGYLLYIWLGRLVRLVAGDGHASLVWISVVAGSALVGVIYLLASRWFGRPAGLAAGLFALTSPQLWFHSEVALTYLVDGLLVCLLVGRCVRVAARGDGRWTDAIGLGLLVAVIGGVRQQSVPALAPVLLYTCWRFPRRRRLGALVAMAVVAAAGAM
ncbi:glycosyltransferase family 39 protein, partial [bacterium]|nr:glycosyltransferase family 39 protein [bacterium]